VIFDISMSLDGFVTASNVGPEEPLGDGGQELHEWTFVGLSSRADAPTTFRLRGGGRTARRALLGFRCLSSPTPSLRRCLRGSVYLRDRRDRELHQARLRS
jgi:hypothetical protein